MCVCAAIGAAGGSCCGTIGAGTTAKFNAFAAFADFFSSSCENPFDPRTTNKIAPSRRAALLWDLNHSESSYQHTRGTNPANSAHRTVILRDTPDVTFFLQSTKNGGSESGSVSRCFAKLCNTEQAYRD
jgi:hypothetical protein